MFLCHNCGQVTEINQTSGVFCVKAPRFCPYCGAQMLEKVKSSFVSLQARCFKALKADPQLVQLLYENWKSNEDAVQSAYPLFADYARAVLAPR